MRQPLTLACSATNNGLCSRGSDRQTVCSTGHIAQQNKYCFLIDLLELSKLSQPCIARKVNALDSYIPGSSENFEYFHSAAYPIYLCF